MLTNRTLLKRIILNLIKNAVEDGTDMGPIEINNYKDDLASECTINVKSAPLIPLETQLQMFQRCFSTKGKGRGWGTYNIRLLTENFLKGTVYFISNEQERTVFNITIPELRIPC